MKRVSSVENCSCGAELRDTKVSRTIPLAGRNVKVENIKATICDDCGEAYLDGPSILKIETRLLKQSALAKT